MKKILLFIDCLGAGGAQRQIVGLARELCIRGYDIKLCVYTDIPFYLPEVNKYNIPYEYISSAHNKLFRIYFIYKYVKRFKPDCVISYQETPSLIMTIVKTFYNKFKLIVSERNTTQVLTMMDRIRFFLYRKADFVVSNSYTQNNFMKENFPSLRNKCTTIVNFVDTDKFKRIAFQKSSKPTFIIVASISNSKNTLNFLRSLNLVLEKNYSNFVVKWFGIVNSNDPYYLSCKKYIEENSLKSVVALLPKTLKIYEEYAKADFFCLPSLYEGTPNALCEALSCSFPSICSNVSDNSYYVKNGFNGYVFDPKSPQSIASSIIKCLNMPNKEYLKFSENSRTTAITKLNVNTFVESYIKLLNTKN